MCIGGLYVENLQICVLFGIYLQTNATIKCVFDNPLLQKLVQLLVYKAGNYLILNIDVQWISVFNLVTLNNTYISVII